MSVTRSWIVLLLLLGSALVGIGLLGVGASAFAADARPEQEQTFLAAAQAIERGAFTEAIDGLELLADHGLVHPDASYNRGLAYLARARSSAPIPGDRGQAMAALRETLLLRPDDGAARLLLEEARRELERVQARSRAQVAFASPPAARVLVGLLHENTWAALALLLSLSTGVGLGLRRWGMRRAASTASALTLSGSIIAGVGGLGLLVTGGATFLARSLRHTSEPAVVIVESARLLDEPGRPLREPPLPEGTELYVVRAQGPLAKLHGGSRDIWVRRSDIRTLAAAAP